MRRQLVNGFFKKVLLQHAGGTGKRAQAAGAFGAAQVARGRWFKRNGDGKSPLHGFFQPAAHVVACPHFRHIQKAAQRELADEIEAVVPVGPRHGVLKKLRPVPTLPEGKGFAKALKACFAARMGF